AEERQRLVDQIVGAGYREASLLPRRFPEPSWGSGTMQKSRRCWPSPPPGSGRVVYAGILPPIRTREVMPDLLSPILPDWQTAGLIVALLLLVASAAVGQRMRTRIRRLASALDHMSQGLCMFDGSSRIVFCNKPFLRMYDLSASVAKPGCTLRALLEHRKHTGLLSLDVEPVVSQR